MRGVVATVGAAGLLSVAACVYGSETKKPIKTGSAFDVAPKCEPLLGQMNASAAFDGQDTYLVVWEEGWPEPEPGTDIKAARVKADGSILDPEGITICKAKDFQERPVAAFGGGQWLVVWQDLRNGKDHDLYGARLTRDGRCLDPDGVFLYGGPQNQVQPSLTSDGRNFCVAWADYRSGAQYEISLGRVGPDGKPVDGEGVPAVWRDIQVQRSHNPQLVWTGSHWLLAASVWRHVGWKPMGPPLSVTVSAELETWGSPESCSQHRAPHSLALASDGDRSLLVYGGNAGAGRTGPPPIIALLLDSDTARPLETSNPPNDYTRGFMGREVALSRPWGARHLRVAASDGLFLVVASGLYHGIPSHGKGTSVHSVRAARVRASDGRALDGVGKTADLVTLVSSDSDTGIPANPAVAGGQAGQFLVVYESDRGIGKRRIEARFVQAK